MIEITNNHKGHAKLVRREAEQLGATLAERRGHEDAVRALQALQDGYAAARPLTSGPEVEVRLRFLSELLAVGDGLLDNLVADARLQGLTWAQIGAQLGVSKQAAQQRFGRAA